jgi:hypothetical protein
MSRADTFAFICGCLADRLSEPARETFRSKSRAGAIDWTGFVAMASERLIAPALLSAARANRLDDLLPSDVADYLDGMATLNRLRNDAIRAELGEVAAIFASIGVVPVLIKGAAHLMSGLYDDPGDRVMTDIDLMVPQARLDDCVDALKQKGFAILFDNGFPAHHHFPPLGRKGDIASIELHVEALDAPYGGLLRSAEIFATSVALDHDLRLALPSPQAQSIIAVAHAELANHGYLYGELSLRDLLDTARLCRRHGGAIDWSHLAQRYAEHGAATALACHLAALGELLRVPLPPEVPIGARAWLMHALAVRQVAHPHLASIRTRLLRTILLFRRSLSSAPLRRRLLQTVRDPAWLTRHLRLLLGKGG